MKSGHSFLTGLLVGAVIGGILALLYAPQSGKETREQLKKKFMELEKELEAFKLKASDKSEQLRHDIEARLAELKKEFETYANPNNI
jgi:gas vesicle protein